MKLYRILLALVVVLLSGNAFSADYYYGATSTGPVRYISDCQTGAIVGCVAGDDSNAGTSPTAPWQTVGKVFTAASGAAVGTQYLFARGASFTAPSPSIWIANSSSTKTNPILFDVYTPSWGTGASPRPRITVANAGVTIFNFQDGGTSDHDEGYVVRDLDLQGAGLGQFGVSLLNDANYILLDHLNVEGFAGGVYVGGGNSPSEGSDSTNDNVTLRNSTIVNNSGQGFLGAGSNFVVEGNTFDNNGFHQAIYDHNMYITATPGRNMVNGWIHGNTLTHASIVNGKCSSVSLVAHGHMQDLLIENNTIQEDLGGVIGNCYGLALDPGDVGHLEGFPGAIIRRNKIINVGGVGIGLSACPNCVVEDNVIIAEQSPGFLAIAIPVSVESTGDELTNNVTVRNNSIYFGSAVSDGVGIRMGYEGTSHVVASNAIHYLGAGTGPGWTCFDTTGVTSSAFEAFDNNLCFFPNVAIGKWEKTVGSLVNWRTASGLDTNSIQADPLFTSPGTPNFDLTIPIGSPAVDHGSLTHSSPQDILGLTRDLNPDIGAYEEGATSTYTSTGTGTGVDAGTDAGADANTGTGTGTSTSTQTQTASSTGTSTSTSVASGSWINRIGRRLGFW